MNVSTRARRRAARLDDPRLESLRTPARRRALVAGLVALLAAEAAALAVIEAAPVLAAVVLGVLLIAFVFCLGAVKAATRGVEELSPDALDERQRQVRGLVYVHAYKLGAGLLMVGLGAAALWALTVATPPPPGLFLVCLVIPFQLAIVLPTLVAAWMRGL